MKSRSASVGFSLPAPERKKIPEKHRFRLEKSRNRVILRSNAGAPVAQLDRASASGVEGHEFESRRVYHF